MISDPEIAERLATLDARDKILRQQMTKQTELSQAQAYIGTCQDMCPERERCLRIGSSLSIFERDEENQASELWMVKEYRRAGADQEEPLPHDLRTPEALERTMNYLCYNIMDDPRSKTTELVLHWYDFLWDRLRAIRKDITQQNICNQTSAILVERCTRFHIHSCYAMNYVKDFDVDMNKRNLNDCLQMLRQMYSDLRNIGVRCEGELEFQKYDILLHLEEDQLSSSVAMKTSEHRSSVDMKYVTQLFFAYTNNYYYKFFKLMEEADYMTSCILSLYVNKVRLNAMKIIIASCTSKQPIMYPADLMIEALAFDDLEDLTSFASCLNIEIQEKKGKYFLVLSKDLINVVRQAGTNMQPLKSIRLVESKMMNMTVGQLVHRQPVTEPLIVAMDCLSEPQILRHDNSLSPIPDRQSSPKKLTPPHLPLHEDPIINAIIPDRHAPAISDTSIPLPSVIQECMPDDLNKITDPVQEDQPMRCATPSSVSSDRDQLLNEIMSEELQYEAERAEQNKQQLRKVATELPVCRLKFRQQPRFHPFEPKVKKKEEPKKKRTSFCDSIQSLKDEVSDEMKANENLLKIVRMIS